MRQHLANHIIALSRQTRQNLFEIGIRVISIEFVTLNQTHYRRAALARTQRPGEQAVVSSDGNRSNLVELGLRAVADQLVTPAAFMLLEPGRKTLAFMAWLLANAAMDMPGCMQVATSSALNSG